MVNNFVLKTVSLLLILGGIAYYQYNAQIWNDKETKNKAKIAEIEEYNKKALNAAGTSIQPYKDGIYNASAMGFGGDIKVEVIINKGIIEAVNIKEAKKEDDAYLDMAKGIINSIIEKQSPDVDLVSGATYSSTGIRDAVKKALENAE